jgi:hypothetical protein
VHTAKVPYSEGELVTDEECPVPGGGAHAGAHRSKWPCCTQALPHSHLWAYFLLWLLALWPLLCTNLSAKCKILQFCPVCGEHNKTVISYIRLRHRKATGTKPRYKKQKGFKATFFLKLPNPQILLNLQGINFISTLCFPKPSAVRCTVSMLR